VPFTREIPPSPNPGAGGPVAIPRYVAVDLCKDDFEVVCDLYRNVSAAHQGMRVM
jgi:hypothetical protein